MDCYTGTGLVNVTERIPVPLSFLNFEKIFYHLLLRQSSQTYLEILKLSTLN